MIARTKPNTVPATLINTVFVTLFFEFVGPDDELPRESDNKQIRDIRYYAMSYAILLKTGSLDNAIREFSLA